jgi:hypothetical protein
MTGSKSTASNSHFATFIGVSVPARPVGGGGAIV